MWNAFLYFPNEIIKENGFAFSKFDLYLTKEHAAIQIF